MKLFLAICISFLLFSCGSSAEESGEKTIKSKYYLSMTGSGETIESNNCNYSGNSQNMHFEIDGKGEMYVYELYTLMDDAELSSLEGQTFPAKVVWNLAEFEGEIKVDKLTEEKGDSDFGSEVTMTGHFSGDKDTEIDFSVNIFKMN